MAIAVALCLSPSLGLAATTNNITSAGNEIIATNRTNERQSIDVNGVTLTVNSGITVNTNGNNAVRTNDNDNITIINNSGSVISSTSSGANNGNNAINAGSTDTLTITNSGRISADKESAIQFNNANNINITNNSGGEILSHKDTIDGNSTNLTVTNSGKIYVTTAGTFTSRPPEGAAMDLSTATNAIITNNSGGEIYTDVNDAGTGATINMGASSSITNSGQIRDDSSQNFTMDFSGGYGQRR